MVSRSLMLLRDARLIADSALVVSFTDQRSYALGKRFRVVGDDKYSS